MMIYAKSLGLIGLAVISKEHFGIFGRVECTIFVHFFVFSCFVSVKSFCSLHFHSGSWRYFILLSFSLCLGPRGLQM
jgi:hypothetical protein